MKIAWAVTSLKTEALCLFLRSFNNCISITKEPVPKEFNNVTHSWVVRNAIDISICISMNRHMHFSSIISSLNDSDPRPRPGNNCKCISLHYFGVTFFCTFPFVVEYHFSYRTCLNMNHISSYRFHRSAIESKTLTTLSVHKSASYFECKAVFLSWFSSSWACLPGKDRGFKSLTEVTVSASTKGFFSKHSITITIKKSR